MSRYADIIVHRLLLAALERSDWWAGGEVSTQLFNNSQLQVSSYCQLPASGQLAGLVVAYKHQANLLSMKNYTPLVISRNDKNKQLTLLS
jgi:hypothetical protein